MLQINIKHNTDSTVKIESIQEVHKDTDSNVLASFDNVNGMIELEICKPFIGQEIKVFHNFDDVSKNYAIRATLEGVNVDKNTNIKSISYQPLETIE